MPIDTPLTTLFCLIDDFCTDISEQVEQYMLTCGKIKRVRQSQICASDVITLLYAWGHEKNEIECLENSRMYQASLEHCDLLLSSNALPGQTLDHCL